MTDLQQRSGVSRRSSLMAAAAAGGAAMLPGWMLDAGAAWAAPPIGPSDGILVVLLLGGGNDGLNTVVPLGEGRYYDLRPRLAVQPSAALALAPGYGLHPALPTVKAMWDEGRVAVVQGVGYPNPNQSHFDSMAIWMAGHASGGNPGSGWLGRWLDAQPGVDPLQAVSIGNSVPLSVRGNWRSGTALPSSLSGAFGANRRDISDARMYDAVKAMADGAQLGQWGDSLAAMGRTTIDLAGVVSPAYAGLPQGQLVRDMALTAKLINANVGLRVLHVALSAFDNHANQAGDHARLLGDVDLAISTFYATLSAEWRSRVTIMTMSEFGRRPDENGSAGTDHGTANNLLVIGDGVRPGLYGMHPSLSTLDRYRNMVHTVDFRSVYATVLDSWLGADSREVLAGSYENLGFFQAAPSEGSRSSGRVPAFGGRGTGPYGYWLTTVAGEVSAFGDAPHLGNAPAGSEIVAMASRPARDGYWLVSPQGAVYAFGQAPFCGGVNDRALSSPIVGMASSPTGDGYWLLGRDGGVFSFGDAEFYGSTGDIVLNQPIVAMAAVPEGRGYWFVGADGGVFAFGPDAGFFGSTGGIHLNRPVVGMAPTPAGGGYWLVADDGGVFSFGDAEFFGSTGDVRLNQQILKMAASPSGQGYWFVAVDGGIFSFGDAPFHGSLAPYGVVVTSITA